MACSSLWFIMYGFSDQKMILSSFAIEQKRREQRLRCGSLDIAGEAANLFGSNGRGNDQGRKRLGISKAGCGESDPKAEYAYDNVKQRDE